METMNNFLPQIVSINESKDQRNAMELKALTCRQGFLIA